MPAIKTKKEMRASEERTLEDAIAAFHAAEERLPTLLRRLRRHTTIEPGASVLDLGAAQGAYVAALSRAGFKARGVEPWLPAIETSRELTAAIDVDIDISQGRGEELPFEDASFDLVLAVSVMEHVDDPDRVFEEVSRVLRPGGAMYFYTGTSLCPRQYEIAGFPLFPWYPDRLRRRIMRWAVDNRPELVGYTERPAYNWFTPWGARRSLRRAGFSTAVDVWNLVETDDFPLAVRAGVAAARRNTLCALGGYVTTGRFSFLAIK